MSNFHNESNYYYPEEKYEITQSIQGNSTYAENIHSSLQTSPELLSYDHNHGMNDYFFPNQSYHSSSLAEEDESYETSLFLGDLSVYSTEKDIRNLFNPYGIIERIRIKRGSSGKPHLSYGFITFRDRESAERALQELNGVVLLGRALRLGWAEPKSVVKAPKVKTEQPLKTAQIHVSYISKQIDMLITEETLRQIFSRFGKVVDVALKKSQFDKRLKLQNGYGFVHFPLDTDGIQAAVDATYNIHQVTVDRVTYDCSLSRYLDDFQLPPPRIYPEFVRRAPVALKPSLPTTNPYRQPSPTYSANPRGYTMNSPEGFQQFSTYGRQSGTNNIAHPAIFPQRVTSYQPQQPFHQQLPIADARNNNNYSFPIFSQPAPPMSFNVQDRNGYNRTTEDHNNSNLFTQPPLSHLESRDNIISNNSNNRHAHPIPPFRYPQPPGPLHGNDDHDITTTLQNMTLSTYGPAVNPTTLPMKNSVSLNYPLDDQSFLEFRGSSSSTYSK